MKKIIFSVKNNIYPLNINIIKTLIKIKRNYDGFSFDGKTRVYNPFSILNFFSDQEFNN